MTANPKQMRCLACDATFDSKLPTGHDARYCPACGYPAYEGTAKDQGDLETEPPSHPDLEAKEGQEGEGRIGRYQALGIVGKGGMGCVYLAYDPICRRRVALKQIRQELARRTVLYRRFLREAWITSQLTHPGVIPIYTIHAKQKSLYYTMPYVEGRTLKEVLRESRRNHKSEEGSIPTLTRVFLNLCQVVAYAHSQGVLHRDLKPENIMLGNFGEVFVLDWGLAGWTGERVEHTGLEGLPQTRDDPELTSPGKIFGTVAYLAPERALGSPTTTQTDIYALGVILYQILCLRLPFKRESLKALRELKEHEPIINAAKRAPYRNVPAMLSRIARKCLEPNPEDRYQTVSEILHDVESYLEGRSEWFPMATLDIEAGDVWEFQENVYLPPKIAFSEEAEAAEWVNMMISKQSFPGNVKLTTRVRIGEEGKGIGFLLCVPEATERRHPNAGYCLWLGSDLHEGLRLFRAEVEVLDQPLSLSRGQWHRLRIEYLDNSLYLYLNDQLQMTYVGHLPLGGTHVGLLVRDANFEMEPLQVSVGSYRVRVNCLAVPDAFLAARDYSRALSEYRRVAYSFPDRDEGREARFRAGLTLLEEAKRTIDAQEQEEAYNQALDEFALLHSTPGAPLEYLGKALVYQAMGESEEETKCFDLAFRRYPDHPLLPLLEQQVLFRLHEKGKQDRWTIYRYMLLTAQHLEEGFETKETARLVASLERHWEPLPLFQTLPDRAKSPLAARLTTASQIAYSLAKPYTLAEVAKRSVGAEEPLWTLLGNILFALIDLGSHSLALSCLQSIEEESRESQPITALRAELSPIFVCHEQCLSSALHIRSGEGRNPLRTLAYLMEFALRKSQPELVALLAEQLPQSAELSEAKRRRFDGYQIWAYLLLGESEEAGALLEKYPLEELTQETSILHTLYGCYLANTEGEEIALAHFSGVLDVPYPRSWVLLGHYLTSRISGRDTWEQQIFLWERRQLYRQLHLYYHCLGFDEQAEHYKIVESRQYIHAAD